MGSTQQSMAGHISCAWRVGCSRQGPNTKHCCTWAPQCTASPSVSLRKRDRDRETDRDRGSATLTSRLCFVIDGKALSLSLSLSLEVRGQVWEQCCSQMVEANLTAPSQSMWCPHCSPGTFDIRPSSKCVVLSDCPPIHLASRQSVSQERRLSWWQNSRSCA